MSTVVYHQHQGNNNSGNNSQLQPPCYEMTASIRLRGPSPSPPCLNAEEVGGWSSLQTLSSSSSSSSSAGDSPYIHPLEKRPSYRKMSERSLAMCTEFLGSETGADIMESDFLAIFNSSDSPPPPPSQDAGKSRNVVMNNKKKNTTKIPRNNFPPPLTTISGPTSLHLTSHREGGRLVITAADEPTKRSFRQVEGSSSRLKIFYYNGSENSHEEDEEVESEGSINNGEEEEERDMDGNTLDVEVETERKKCVRGRGCKEGGHNNEGPSHWGESFWLTT